jgi:hypothetical protein
MTMTIRTSRTLLLLAALAACTGADNEVAQDAPADGGAPAAESPAVTAPGGTTMHLTITGGAKAGNWTKSQSAPTCTLGYAGKGVWGVAGNDLENGGTGLRGIDLTVPDAANAKGGTPKFRFTAYIGGTEQANQVEIDPESEKGSGTATIDDRGGTATVTVKGRTADGAEVDAHIECGTVMRG